MGKPVKVFDENSGSRGCITLDKMRAYWEGWIQWSWSAGMSVPNNWWSVTGVPCSVNFLTTLNQVDMIEPVAEDLCAHAYWQLHLFVQALHLRKGR
jgi:hypothetical protein